MNTAKNMSLSRLLIATFLLSLTCLLPNQASSAIRDHQIEIEFAFDCSAYPDRTVVAYRLYKAGELVCQSDAIDPHVLDCTITSSTGQFDFTMVAVYNDGSTSPESAPFAYTIVDETSPLLGLLALTGQTPQHISGLGSIAGSESVDLADVISLLQEQATSAL